MMLPSFSFSLTKKAAIVLGSILGALLLGVFIGKVLVITGVIR